ncbi:MAG: hypothetical protein ACI9OJ_000048, partial [Myxococcota bacterium]
TRVIVIVIVIGSIARAETPPGTLDLQATLNAGWAALSVGDPVLATQHYARATRLVPDSEDAWLGLQLAHLSELRWDAALSAGDRVLALNPKSFWALGRNAFAYYNLGQFQRAEVGYQAALGVNANDPAMLLGLGFSRLERGDRDGAKSACEAASRLLVDDPRATDCLERADARTWHLSGSLTTTVMGYSPSNTLEGLWAVGVTAGVDWDWGIGFWAGAIISETQLAYEPDDYHQQVPGFGFWVERNNLTAGLNFAWLLSNDEATDRTPVLSGRLGYRGATIGTGLAAAVSIYPEGPTATQLDPWLEWRPNPMFSLQTGLSLSLIADSTDDETLASGWITVGYRAAPWLSIGLSGFGGPRRYRVEASGLSVWANDQKTVGGYGLAVTFRPTEWLDVFASFRHDFGTERSAAGTVPTPQQRGPVQTDSNFQLMGGTFGVRARY